MYVKKSLDFAVVAFDLFLQKEKLNFSKLQLIRPNIMVENTSRRQVFSVVFLCVIWYIVSSSNNVIGKMVLNEFPFPLTVTIVQLTSIACYSGPFFNLWGVRKYVDIPWKYYFKYIVPLALGKFFASVSSHISIWRVPVSYAHTGKCCLIFYLFLFWPNSIGGKTRDDIEICSIFKFNLKLSSLQRRCKIVCLLFAFDMTPM